MARFRRKKKEDMKQEEKKEAKEAKHPGNMQRLHSLDSRQSNSGLSFDLQNDINLQEHPRVPLPHPEHSTGSTNKAIAPSVPVSSEPPEKSQSINSMTASLLRFANDDPVNLHSEQPPNHVLNPFGGPSAESNSVHSTDSNNPFAGPWDRKDSEPLARKQYVNWYYDNGEYGEGGL